MKKTKRILQNDTAKAAVPFPGVAKAANQSPGGTQSGTGTILSSDTDIPDVIRKTADSRLGCVIMAAGNSRRFGKNKLNVLINGKPMLEYIFKAVPTEKLHSVCVVTQYDEAETLASLYDFRCIRNDRPEDGLSYTIKLGTKALSKECDAILYMVADQPLLTQGSVAGLINLYLKNPGHIVSASSGGQRGNPCIFPKKYFPSLEGLTGDTGGSRIIRKHIDDLILFEIPERELCDADTPEALRRIEDYPLFLE
ncbi:MAG: nucleotidyltransferase family protein [Lachnospiraceae bacterium]|nr:nucleotidyltransferase family protein [Lachnospiraceae bacterium]